MNNALLKINTKTRGQAATCGGIIITSINLHTGIVVVQLVGIYACNMNCCDPQYIDCTVHRISHKRQLVTVVSVFVLQK